MRRGRLSKENHFAPSSNPRGSLIGSIGRGSVTRRRSSSADYVSRGSYLPPPRRASVERERFRPGSAAKPHLKLSPRRSSNNLFGFQRGSLAERKAVKDQRPLADKSYQKECVHKLVRYLEEAKFPYSITPANMMPPTKKDFQKVFQFLYSVWDPKLEIAKLEDDAPKLMKTLGYPFMLNKSSFLTINRMSWPTLLGVLMWLMELNKISSSMDISHYVSGGEGFQNDGAQHILVNYILQSFRSSSEDSERDLEVFTNIVAQKYNMDYSSGELETKYAQLEAAVEKESGERTNYLNIIEECKAFEKDIENYENYKKEMEERTRRREEQLKNQKDKRDAKEKELVKMKELVVEKEAIYKAQGFDAQYAHNFYQVTKRDLREKLESKKKAFQEEQKLCWDLEIQLFHAREELATSSNQFTPLWDELREAMNNSQMALCSFSSTAKLAKKSKRQTLPEFKMFPGCIDDVSEVLGKLKTHCEEQRSGIQDIIGSKQNALSELQTKMSDLSMKEQMGSVRLSQKEREVEMLSKENDDELISINQEYEALVQKLDNLTLTRARIKQQIAALKKSLNESRLRKEKLRSDLEDKEEKAEVFKKDMKMFTQQMFEQIQLAKAKTSEEESAVLQQMESKQV